MKNPCERHYRRLAVGLMTYFSFVEIPFVAISRRGLLMAASRRKRVLLGLLLLLLLGAVAWWTGGFLRAGRHARLARAAIARRDFPKARKHLAECLRHAPRDSDT